MDYAVVNNKFKLTSAVHVTIHVNVIGLEFKFKFLIKNREFSSFLGQMIFSIFLFLFIT